MGGIQIPFGVISSAGADLADPENDLENYFLRIDTQRIGAVIASAFGSMERVGEERGISSPFSS